MLYLNVPIGDSLVIDDGRVVVHFEKRAGKGEIRIGVEAERTIPIRVSSSGRQEKPWARGLTEKQAPRKSEVAK